MLLVAQCVATWCAFCDLNPCLQCLSIAAAHQEVNLRFENLPAHQKLLLPLPSPPSLAHLIYLTKPEFSLPGQSSSKTFKGCSCLLETVQCGEPEIKHGIFYYSSGSSFAWLLLILTPKTPSENCRIGRSQVYLPDRNYSYTQLPTSTPPPYWWYQDMVSIQIKPKNILIHDNFTPTRHPTRHGMRQAKGNFFDTGLITWSFVWISADNKSNYGEPSVDSLCVISIFSDNSVMIPIQCLFLALHSNTVVQGNLRSGGEWGKLNPSSFLNASQWTKIFFAWCQVQGWLCESRVGWFSQGEAFEKLLKAAFACWRSGTATA